MSFYLESILKSIRETSDLKFDDLMCCFNELKHNVSNKTYEKVRKCILENDGDLDFSYKDLFFIYKELMNSKI